MNNESNITTTVTLIIIMTVPSNQSGQLVYDYHRFCVIAQLSFDAQARKHVFFEYQ